MSKIYVDEIAGIASADTVAIPGHVIQIVQSYKTDTYSNSTASYTDISDLSVTITPNSINSTFLIMVNLTWYSSFFRADVRLLRDSTEIGNADASGTRTTAFMPYANQQNDADDGSFFYGSMNYLDDPNLSSTSSITYKLQGRGRVDSASYSNTFHINRSIANRDVGGGAYDPIGTSSIIVMEIAG